MSGPAEIRCLQQTAGRFAVATLAWSLWSGLGQEATAKGLGQDMGQWPLGSTSLVASTIPCRDDLLRPTSNRAWDQQARPPIWLVADCATEANKIPTNLQATGTPSVVSISWTAPTTGGVAKYRVERSVNQGPFVEIAQPTGTSYSDTAVTGSPTTTYVYRVRADYGGSPPLLSAPSNVDVATTITFTDDNALAGKVVDDQHITELRSAATALCKTAGESTPTWTDPTITPQQTVIKKAHIDELRAKISECLAAVGVVTPPYSTDGTIIAGTTTIKKEHVQELRNAMH